MSRCGRAQDVLVEWKRGESSLTDPWDIVQALDDIDPLFLNDRVRELDARTAALVAERDGYRASIEEVRALAELGVREQWPPDEWRAGIVAALPAPAVGEPDVVQGQGDWCRCPEVEFAEDGKTCAKCGRMVMPAGGGV